MLKQVLKKVLCLLLAVQTITAAYVEPLATKSVEIEVQRKKEQKTNTLGDAARIIGGSGCLIAAFLFYREARRHWCGLNDQDIKEQAIKRIKEMDFYKTMYSKIFAEERNEEAALKKADALAVEKAVTSKQLDIGENVVLAVGFTYFGFNLLAKGLHIIK